MKGTNWRRERKEHIKEEWERQGDSVQDGEERGEREGMRTEDLVSEGKGRARSKFGVTGVK